MKKRLLTALSTAAIAAMAMPALADHTISGYFRTTGTLENSGIAKDDNPIRAIEQRVRARWQNNLNEYVTVVWFGEVDAIWGNTVTKAAANPANTGTELGGGGRQGADGVNVETKHAYLDLKVPNAPMALAMRLGAQPFSDQGVFSGVLMDDDMSGVKFDVKNDMMSATVGWFKLLENDLQTADDNDLFAVQANLMPLPALKLSPQFFYSRNELTADTQDGIDEYYAGLGASYKLAPLDLSGWFLYDFGTKTDASGNDTDISAWIASAKAAADVAGARVGLRLIYTPASSDKTDRTYFAPPNGNNGFAEFADENLMLFLFDPFAMNVGKTGRAAITDAAYAGYGLFGAALSGSFNLPEMKALTLKAGLGYFMATDKSPDGKAEREGTNLGTEASLQAFYKIGEKVDVALRGSYAFLGNFYDKQAEGGTDPNNLYKLTLMVNVPY